MAEHKNRCDDNRIHRTIQHYGWGNFEIDIIDVYSKRIDADTAEMRYIKEYNTLSPNGYNLTAGGETKKQISQETRDKMSKSQKERAARPEDLKRRAEISKKRFEDPDERERMLKLLSTGKDTPEYKAKISQSQKERYKRPEEMKRKKEMASKWGKEHAEEYSIKMKKYYNNNPESKDKISKRMKEYYNNPEKRKELSERNKKLWEDPEYREKMKEAMKNRVYDKEARSAQRKQYYIDHPEARKNISDKSKARWGNPEYREKHMAAYNTDKRKQISRDNIQKYNQKIKDGIIPKKEYPNKCITWIENNIGHLKVPYKNTFFIILFDEDRINEIAKIKWTVNIGAKKQIIGRYNNKSITMLRYLYPEIKELRHINKNTMDNRAINLKVR